MAIEYHVKTTVLSGHAKYLFLVPSGILKMARKNEKRIKKMKLFNYWGIPSKFIEVHNKIEKLYYVYVC